MGNENALAIIERAQRAGALVFVNRDNLESRTKLYRTEVTQIQAKPDEFHKVNGKFMPNKAVTDRIGEANGIQFIDKNCYVETQIRPAVAGLPERCVYVGYAQGKVRMPDGNWRESTVENYEFDPTLRAAEDAPNKKDYGKPAGYDPFDPTNKSKFNRDVLAYIKPAMARAATGARLRVIRQLSGMPETFSAEDINRPLAFARVVQNTEYILETPEGRTMATAKALDMDVSSLLFGKKPESSKAVESAPRVNTADIHENDLTPADTSGFETNPADTASLANQANPAGGKSPEDQEFEELTVSLEALLESNKDVLNTVTRTGNPYEKGKAELDKLTATIESRKAMISNLTNWLAAYKGGAA